MKRAEQLARDAGGIDPKFFNQVSQFAHFGMMFFVCMLVGTVGALAEHPWSGVITGFLVCTGYATVHEFWYDPKFENAETRGSDLEDFVFLMIGASAAVLVLLIWIGISEM